MTFLPGDKITYYPAAHPRAPREAVFIAAYKTRVRIQLKEKDGNTRTLLTMADCIGKPAHDATPAVSVSCGGFRK